MKNENILILAFTLITVWLIGLTWGILNIDHKINPPDYISNKDTVYIHDTIYLEKEGQ